MFAQSAEFYDAIYHFKDYRAEALRLHDLICHWRPGSRSLVDVACGTGKHLETLRQHYEVEGIDLNPESLRGARVRCPGVRFHHGDMRHFDLGRRFDVVTCLFSAIGYMADTDELNRAMTTMSRHLTPGGVLIVEPWFTPESYRRDRVTVNLLDAEGFKGAWMYVSRRDGTRSILDIEHLIAGPSGIERFTERHELTLFTADQMIAAFQSAGLRVRSYAFGLTGRGLYVGQTTGSSRSRLGST